MTPLLITAQVASVATLVSLLLGTALGMILTWRRLPARRFMGAITLLPLVLPPTVLGYFLLVLLGRRSVIGRLWEDITGGPLVFTLTAAVIAATVSAVPIIARQVGAAAASIDHDVIEAAMLDGAGRIAIARHVYMPLLAPSLVAAGSIAFARSAGDFGATLMVAGNIPGRTQTASIAIYDLMNAGREAEAMALVAAISALSIAVLLLASFLIDREVRA